MVKVGPKLPPPTRRELDRQERELKRAEGANAAQLGEPREHLAFLVYRKSRSKRPESSALGNSWKKWEKNQRRHEARRLAKAKANITSLGSRECVDFSRSDLLDHDHSNGKGPKFRGDNSEAPHPYLDSSAGEIHGVVVDSDYNSLGSLSGEFSSMTDTSISISSSGNPGFLDDTGFLALSMTPLARLGVDIITDDFWFQKNGVSVSLSESKENILSVPVKILPTEPMNTEKPVEKARNASDITQPSDYNAYIQPFDCPKPPSQAPPIALSRMLPSRRSRTGMNAAVAPPRLSSRKSSFIFSEPLDMSKYMNRSYTSASNGYSPQIEIGTFVQDSPDPFGKLLASGKRIDNTPKIGTVHGPYLTPSPKTSAYASSRNAVQPADQSLSATGETGDWNSRSANRILPAVHATSARKVVRVASDSVITHAAYKEGDPVNNLAEFDQFRDTSNFGIQQRGTSVPRKLYNDIGSSPALQSNAHLLSSDHELSTDNKSVTSFNSASDTTRHLQHSKDTSDTLQIQTGSPKNNARVVLENSSFNGSAIISSTTPVLAPAACITYQKKPKPFHTAEIQSSFVQPPRLENGQEVSPIRYPDTPPTSCSGIVPPASTPRSPLLFAIGLPSPSWSRPSILPRHASDTSPETNSTSPRGFVSALKWMFRKTFRYFWQRRG